MESEKYYRTVVVRKKEFSTAFMESWCSMPSTEPWKRVRIVSDGGKTVRAYDRPYFCVKVGVPITFRYLMAIHAYFVQEEGYAGTVEDLFRGILFVEMDIRDGFPADDSRPYLMWTTEMMGGMKEGENVAYSFIREDLPLGI